MHHNQPHFVQPILKISIFPYELIFGNNKLYSSLITPKDWGIPAGGEIISKSEFLFIRTQNEIPGIDIYKAETTFVKKIFN